MKITVLMKCPLCGVEHEVDVEIEQFVLWHDAPGENIQEIFPDLTPTERRQLMSHLCPECQARLFRK